MSTRAKWSHEDLPDIYFIVLDSYARQDVLDEIYNFDNSEFVGYLRDAGFYVASSSTTNYNQTTLTLASMLNMQYVDSFANNIGKDSPDLKQLKWMAGQGLVFRLLRNNGYKIADFYSIATAANIGGADMYYKKGWVASTFEKELVNTTPLPVILKYRKTGGSPDYFKLYRRKVL